MTRSLQRSPSKKLTKFDPAKAKLRVAEAEAVIEVAVVAKDPSMLERAAEAKVEELSALVDWWEAQVTVNHGGDRGQSKSRAHGTWSLSAAETQTGFTNQRISQYRKKRKDPERWREDIFSAAWRRAVLDTDKNIAAKWTGDPEWYTPAQYIEAAREVMGGIDLDPASNAEAQEVVRAAVWYGADNSGLDQEWQGRVFLNPPYSFPLVAQFIDKLIDGLEAGSVTQAILLTNNNTDTKWWHRAARLSGRVCFTAGRINFYKPDGSVSQPTNGQSFFYFGPHVSPFTQAFSQFGLIMEISSIGDPIPGPV